MIFYAKALSFYNFKINLIINFDSYINIDFD
jgi:hypothetical protein